MALAPRAVTTRASGNIERTLASSQTRGSQATAAKIAGTATSRQTAPWSPFRNQRSCNTVLIRFIPPQLRSRLGSSSSSVVAWTLRVVQPLPSPQYC